MRPAAFALIFAALAGFATEASAEVRLGRNVKIGGHDFSNQTYGPKRRAVVNLHQGQPQKAGCRWHAAGAIVDGRRLSARTRICHLQRR